MRRMTAATAAAALLLGLTGCDGDDEPAGKFDACRLFYELGDDVRAGEIEALSSETAERAEQIAEVALADGQDDNLVYFHATGLHVGVLGEDEPFAAESLDGLDAACDDL